MLSLPQIPSRLSKIDHLARGEHFYISDDDDCYFLWEWNGAPYAESATTNFIGNFQRETRFRGHYSWSYKEKAVSHAAAALQATLPAKWKALSTFIPVPPSKVESDARYDSRLTDTLTRITPSLPDIRDIIGQIANTDSPQKNISPDERSRNWRVKNTLLLDSRPDHVVVFDDILSGGSHFTAMKREVALLFPGVAVSGLFLARRVLPNPTLQA